MCEIYMHIFCAFNCMSPLVYMPSMPRNEYISTVTECRLIMDSYGQHAISG